MIRRGELRAVRHDGGGRYPLQTIHTSAEADLERAQSLDPGHVQGIYWWVVDGSAIQYPDEFAAAASDRRTP